MSAEPTTTAAEARGAHSIASAARAGLLLWYPIFGPIAAWAIHLLVLSSVVELTCTTGYLWLMHLTTLATVAMVAVAVRMSWTLASAPGDETSDRDGGRLFLGRLGLIVSAVNLLLIAIEEIYVFALGPRRCG